MTGGPVDVAGRPVTLVCSCVRDPAALLGPRTVLAPGADAVRDGDLVLVRALTGTGAYDHVEDQGGTPVRVHAGDEFVAVLGTRRSGTNLVGEVPAGPLGQGDRLDLVAQGGLVAVCTAVPRYYAPALPLEVVGFPTGPDGRVCNLGDAPVVPVGPPGPLRPGPPLLVVCGTSAEVGKTTLACTVTRAVAARRQGVRIALVKACGTGRARDLAAYREAGADTVTDFVDGGLVSTYGVGAERFRAVLAALVEHAAARADLVIVEIGGDFLDARAPEALALLSEAGAEVAMVVNDAMGALEGLRRLANLGRRPLAVATLRQNPAALAERLGQPAERVIHPADEERAAHLVLPLVDRLGAARTADRVSR